MAAFSHFHQRALCNCLWLTCVFALWSTPIHAAVFYVSDTMDSLRPTSLRYAVMMANRGGHNTIYLAGNSVRNPRVYHLSIRGANEFEGRTGDLDLTIGSLTIEAVSPGVIIDASELNDRLFYVGSRANLQLNNLTLRGGNPPGLNSTNNNFFISITGLGGAIYNAGTLIMQNCVMTNNSSAFGGNSPPTVQGFDQSDGGAIYNIGTNALIRCILTDNRCGNGLNGLEGGNGGAIFNGHICSLYECQITNNQAGDGSPMGMYPVYDGSYTGSGGCGGGVYNQINGRLLLNDCYIAGNRAGRGMPGGTVIHTYPDSSQIYSVSAGSDGGSGGGIWNEGTLTANSTTFYNNQCGDGGDGGNNADPGTSFSTTTAAGNGGDGGGLCNEYIATVDTCTFYNNVCGNGGKGGDCLVLFHLFGSYINSGSPGGSGGDGGGILSIEGLTMNSCTIVGNHAGIGGRGGNGLINPTYTAPPAAGGRSGRGGGFYSGYSDYILTTVNSLIALNSVGAGGSSGTNFSAPGVVPITFDVGYNGADGNGYDVFGFFVSDGFNLIGTGDNSTGFTNGVNADQVGTDDSPIDPLLGPLKMNGGFTPTMALLLNSPAIDRGNSFGLHQDQRGDHRPYLHPFIVKPLGGDGSDIGAYEQIPGK